MSTRRTFIRWATLAGSGPVLSRPVSAQRAGMTPVSEKDPQAVALGYVSDATRADKSRFPKYTPGQHCALCQLYQGPATAPAAPCAIFAGKQVAGTGWCSAFVPKTA